MKFECKDLDRALAVPELRAELHEHARNCPECREQLEIWQALSNEAAALHHEWDSPLLWPRIANHIRAEQPVRPKPQRHWFGWTLGAVAAALALVALLVSRPTTPAPNDLLTERALRDVEEAETTYAHSIERLSALAQPRLERPDSPLASAYREKLVVLDAAISDLRAAARENPYNSNLRLELAALYREKQKTLQESMKTDLTKQGAIPNVQAN